MSDLAESVTVDPAYTLLDGQDTGPGSSGSPVWYLGSDGLPEVVGVVSSGNASLGRGYYTQITTSVLNQIQTWIGQDDGTNTQIIGTAGNDTIWAGGADNSFNGDGGHDTMLFHGRAGDYILTVNSDHSITAVDTVASRDGTSQIVAIEYLQFTDTTIFAESADDANIARLYTAALGRTPDKGGLNYWENLYANLIPASAKAEGPIFALAQTPLQAGGGSIAAGFTGSVEFQSKYGSLTDSAFVTQLYNNALSRGPDPGGLTYWTDALQSGTTREMALVGFADSSEGIAKIAAAGWLLTV
jgi:hypothetical protein